MVESQEALDLHKLLKRATTGCQRENKAHL